MISFILASMLSWSAVKVPCYVVYDRRGTPVVSPKYFLVQANALTYMTNQVGGIWEMMTLYIESADALKLAAARGATTGE